VSRLGIRTVLRYLIGDRQAILDLAASRWTLLLGLVFVLSAALAREYDGKDLLHEPWHLLLPLGASLAASALLFAAAWGRPRHYPAFLGLFWMTAPLAWLYAVPYERFLSPADALRANLLTLAVVSVWRVALMVRVLVVLLGYRPLAAVVLVLAFADAAAVAASLVSLGSGASFLAAMAGIRLPESERLLLASALGVAQLGGCSFPLWFAGAMALRTQSKPSWQASSGPSVRPTGPLWGLAAASVAGWVIVLPWTQAEQQLRGQVERDFREGRVEEALAVMSAHAPTDFPPQWEPPPTSRELLGPGDARSHVVQVYEDIGEKPVAPWVRERYLQRLPQVLSFWHFIPEADLERLGRALEKTPEGPAVFTRLEAEEQTSLLERLRPGRYEDRAGPPSSAGGQAGKGKP
jgi:hypothetical protein